MTSKHPSSTDIREAVFERLFTGRVVQNNFRGEVVETIVAAALGDSWQHCSDGWAGWDFQRKELSGRVLRLQVKQSAALQTWTQSKKSTPTFRIAEVSGYYREDGLWEKNKGRHAEIYIFGWHGDSSKSANQYDPMQWIFYVIPTLAIKNENRKSIPLSDVKKLVVDVKFDELRSAVEQAASNI